MVANFAFFFTFATKINLLMHLKKLLLTVLMLSVAFVASAQISNVKTRESSTVISKFRMGLCSLNVREDLYYLGLISTNKLEDPVVVYLGVGKESALQTLKDLLDLHSTMSNGESTKFTINLNGLAEPYRVVKFDKFNFTFEDMNRAGNIYLAAAEIKTLIKKLSSK